jgi:hypothetical protein
MAWRYEWDRGPTVITCYIWSNGIDDFFLQLFLFWCHEVLRAGELENGIDEKWDKYDDLKEKKKMK